MLLSSRRSRVALEIDDSSGAPVALHLTATPPRSPVRMPVTVRVELEVGGAEVTSPVGGLEYVDTQLLSGMRADGPPRRAYLGLDERWSIPTLLGSWRFTWEWTIRAVDAPAVSLALRLEPAVDGDGPLRNLRLVVDCALPQIDRWVVQAPGNTLRADVAVRDLPPQSGISPAGGLRGSSALVALQGPDGLQMAVWPFCRTEMGLITLTPTGTGVSVTYDTDLAGDLEPGESLIIEALHLDLAYRSWEQTKQEFPNWYRTLGVTVPATTPEWVRPASIYEVQLGYSVFWGGHRYEPYPGMGELLADLDRIQALGFDTLQLMPRQPYPSYNVHDYADITVSYGPEDELRQLIDSCHARGLRVILDVLLHGVLDQESIGRAADGVRSGPVFASLDSPLGDSFSTDPNDDEAYRIAWSRHILDFEPHWKAGSPPRSELLDQKPEWFFRNTHGDVMGIYTQAFDARNLDFQAFFIKSMIFLVDRLDIDGFRFDAPTYNGFANWSASTRQRASASPLACTELFRELRSVLKRRKPDLLMYTEPSGVVLRESMDLNYNYDEQWLVSALLGPDTAAADSTVTTARDLADWLRDRDALLPPGAMTAHHIDSHDTFWWPEWGQKWRREQFAIDGVRALATLFLLTGGPYMMFTGGEVGLEETLATINRAKKSSPALARGITDYQSVRVDQSNVFTVLRRDGVDLAVVLVNISAAPLVAALELDAEGARSWTDLLDPSWQPPSTSGNGLLVDLPLWGTRILIPSTRG